MLKKIIVGGALAACLGAHAQESAPAKEATSAEEILGPVNAARPLDAEPEAPAAAATAPQAPAASGPSSRAWPTIGVSVDASILLGLGLSVGAPLGDRFNLRGVYHGYTHDEEIEEDDGNYQAEIRLKTFGAMVDYHPFQGSFRLTAGLKSNGNEINLTGVANDSNEFEVGDCSYNSNPGDPLRVNGAVDFRSTAPYLGIGWGGNLNAEPGFYGIFDIGVMFSGAPRADLNARGSATVSGNPENAANGCGAPGTPVNAATDPAFQQELQDAENEVNEDAKDFKLWPNLSFGFGWRF